MTYSRAENILKKVTTYESSMPEIDYTDVPKSEIDVKRAVNGKPCWKERIVGKDRKPKKWIISDCSIAYGLEVNSLDRWQFFAFILSKGVECYVWTGTLTRVTEINALMDAMKKVELIRPDLLRRILTERGITKSESEIIDYVQVKALCSALQPLVPGMKEQTNEIRISEDIKFTVRNNINFGISESNIEDIYMPAIAADEFLSRFSKKIVFSVYQGEKETNRIITEKKISRDCELIQKFYDDKTLLNFIKDVTNKLIPDFQGVSINYRDFKNIQLLLDQLPDLKYLSINECELTNQQISDIIKKMTHLKSLKITNCQYDEDNNLYEKSMETITVKSEVKMGGETEVININHVKSMQGLLNNGKLDYRYVQSSTVKSITMDNIAESDEKMLNDITELDVEWLDTELDSYDPINLLKILSMIPNLTSIKFGNAILKLAIGDPVKMVIYPEYLNTPIKSDILIVILEHFNRLGKVRLNLRSINDQEVSKSFFGTDNVLNYVNVLDITKLQIMAVSDRVLADLQNRYYQIFQKSPILKELYFDKSCDDEINAFVIFLSNIKRSFPLYQFKMEKITFSLYSRISSENLSIMVSILPKTRIVIDSDILPENLLTIFDYLNMGKPNMEIIKSLDFKKFIIGEITGERLHEWLSHCTEIDHLKCQPITLFPEKPDLILNNLTTLDLSNYKDRKNDFNLMILSMVAHTPNLKELTLPMKSTMLSSSTLFTILQKCPNLEIIYHVELFDVAESDHEKIQELFPNVDIDFKSASTPSSTVSGQQNRFGRDGLNELRYLQNMSQPSWERPSQPSMLDSFTGSTENVTLHARQFFLKKKSGQPTPNIFRLKVHLSLQVGDQISYPDKKFDIKKVKTFETVKDLKKIYDHKFETINNVFYGEITLPASQRDWYPIPSLTTGDEILDLTANSGMILGYCKEQALYYVKPAAVSDQSVTLNYLLKANFQNFPKVESNLPKINFSQLFFSPDGKLIINETSKKILAQISKLDNAQKIAVLKSFCSTFKVKELNIKPQQGVDILNSIIHDAAGVCRHRTFAFMALAKAIGVEARAIENDCHAFVEVLHKNAWCTCDLGGGHANLVIHPVDKMKVPETPIASKQAEISSTAVKRDKTLSPGNVFNTWDTISSHATNYAEYVAEIMQKSADLPAGKRNILIALDAAQIEGFHAHAVRHIQQNKNQFYYLHTLGDVNEYQAIIENGKLDKAESELMQFVRKAETGDALISNWSDFKPSYVGYNTMMDEQRKLKSQDLAKDLSVIVLIDKNNLSSMGEDFFSRFRVVSTCPQLVGKENLAEKLQLQKNDDISHFTSVESYNNDWETFLLGRITINGNQFTLKEGLLLQAIKDQTKSGLLLINAPWQNEDFRLFMTELEETRQFSDNGITYDLPKTFTFKTNEQPYVLEHDCVYLDDGSEQPVDPFILNSQTFNHFLHGIHSQNGLIQQTPGWIGQHSMLTVYVTESLSENAWAELINAAINAHCLLKLVVAEGVVLPAGMKLDQPLAVKSASSQCKIIETNDTEMVEEELLAEHPDALVVSINAHTEFNDLIEKPVRIKGKAEGEFAYESVTGNVWEKLKKGQTVILKGTLSPLLARQFESLFLDPPFLWVNGEKQRMTGKLVLLTDKKNPLSSVTAETRNYQIEHYWQRLDNQYMNDPHYAKFRMSLMRVQKQYPKVQFSYGQLRTMAEKMHQQQLANIKISNPFKPFLRMNPNDPVLVLAKEAWVSDQAFTKNPDVMTRRGDKIISELNLSPYLFVVGPSGVGKSTYIKNRLKERNCEVYVGIEKMKDWLESKDSRDQILFIDEANLEREGTWDSLEGLFNKTPGIMLDGQFHALTPNKKVIFAGNFNHFAGRTQHRYFERHGQVINFKEMPDDVLTSTIIHPALESLFPSINTITRNDVNQLLLMVYGQVNKSLPNHPFTPRNLKSICLRTSALLSTHPQLFNGDMQLALKMAILDEASTIMSKKQMTELENSIQITNRDALLATITANIPSKLGKMVVTASRQYPLHLLQQQFAIRDMIINNPALADFEVPSFLIEGLSGIGKSKMVMEYLKSLGYTEGKLDDGKTGKRNNCYYHITPTDPEIMEAILQKAFREGAYVIIEELNTLPLEATMNKFHDAKTEYKGYAFCGTQNPITFLNREALSVAFINRLTKIGLDDYPEAELREIAASILHDEDKVNKFVGWYLEAKQYAIQHHKIPVPVPRNLFETLASQQLAMDDLARMHPFFNQPERTAKSDAKIPSQRPSSK